MAEPLTFTPSPLPPAGLRWERLLPHLGPAHSAIGRFDALLRNLPDARLLLSPLTTNEAVASSRIEGTQASLEDVMQFQAEQKADRARSDDIGEVLNYRKAMDFAFGTLKPGTMTLSEQLFKDAHRILMSGVRGAEKSPGQFRDRQVYIGRPGRPIEEATYVPPEAGLVPRLIRDLVRYIDSEEWDTLVQLALIHAQFELIHPFRDGNGRIGRLIMPLFLYSKGAIHAPYFYISEYLEKHRETYYGCLKAISGEGDWERWISFFLRAVAEQSSVNAETAQAIVNLKAKMLTRVQELTRSRYASQVVDHLFASPIFTTSGFRRASEVPASSAIRLLQQLEDAGVIKRIVAGKGRRTSTYAFSDLMSILTR